MKLPRENQMLYRDHFKKSVFARSGPLTTDDGMRKALQCGRRRHLLIPGP